MNQADVTDTYRALREAEGEEFEMLSADLRRRADEDAEGVAEAIAKAELPTG